MSDMPTMKTCPECHLEVPDAATRCGHCRHEFLTPEREAFRRFATIAVWVIITLAIFAFFYGRFIGSS